jgi:4-amino-4-deoxy-L-arabinose transferase-like glycosyltransferase
MIAMAKKRMDREKGKKSGEDRECNLDGDYISPIQSFHDISIENIRSLIINSRYIQILILLTLVGGFLRFYNLGFNSVWLDEGTTYIVSLHTYAGIWQDVTTWDFSPPLFYWIEHIMLMFGKTEEILRFVPAVLGLLTIPLIYFVGKEFLDRNVGIIAAIAATFSPFLIFYSQEARAYSMTVFFIAFAMIFYLKALKNNDIKNWVFFGILSALAFWSHYYVFVLIAALVIYAIAINLIDIRKNIKKMGMVLLSVLVFSLACLPIIIVTIQRFFIRTAESPKFGAQGFDIIYSTLLQISGSGEILLFLYVFLFIAGLVHLSLFNKKQALFLISLLFLTFFISYILSYKLPMNPRYLIFLSIPIYIGIGAAYGVFYRLWNTPGIVYVMMAILFLVNVPTLLNYYSGYSKDDWRGFSGQLQNITKDGDTIVLVPAYMYQPLDYYYLNSTDRTFEYGASTVTELETLKKARGNNTIFYIVTWDILAVNPNGDEINWLKNQTRFLGQNTGIYLFAS